MPLDAANAAYLEQLRQSGFPSPGDIPLGDYRALLDAVFSSAPPGPAVAQVEDRRITGSDGTVPVRLYTPTERPKAVMLYLHGGGWTIGSLHGWDPTIRRLAQATGCAIVSVDYRLAPEHPFPAAVDDALTAAKWTAEHLLEIAGTQVPFGIAGDSAGANLSAAATLIARDAGGPNIAFQILAYPTVNGNIDEPSLREFASPRLSLADLRWYFDSYVPDLAHRSDPRFSPINAVHHGDLPPAFILTAENDILRSQAEDYGVKLIAAGVPVLMRRYLGTIHGFLTLDESIPQSGQAIVDIAAYIDGILATGGDREQPA